MYVRQKVIPEGTYFMQEWKKSKEVLSMRMTLKRWMDTTVKSHRDWLYGSIHFYSSQPQKNTVFQLSFQIVEIILLSSGWWSGGGDRSNMHHFQAEPWNTMHFLFLSRGPSEGHPLKVGDTHCPGSWVTAWSRHSRRVSRSAWNML